MSSTGRKSKRKAYDQYMTPRWCGRRLAEVLRIPAGAKAVEPCVGTGNLLAAFPSLDWTAFDIRPATVGEARADFLKLVAVDECDTIAFVITNPPYSLAEEFIRQARALFPNATLCFLLRLSFLGSYERLPLWADVGMPDLNILPNRPSYIEGETDNSEYAWFIFPPEKRPVGHVRMLPNTSLVERQQG